MPPSSGGKPIGAIVVAVVLIAVVAMVALLTVRGTNTGVAVATPVAKGPGEIFLQPASDTGPNPYDPLGNKGSGTTTPSGGITPAPTTTAGVQGVTSVPGGKPGLYGGTNRLSVCDPQQLVNFLGTHQDKATAWVAALNADPTLTWSGGNKVRTDQITAYVKELTSLVLRNDTRVTNNGFLNGKPDPYQAVLQKGTAVLVDKRGVPRSRCACGNPLAAPVPQKGTTSYIGTGWAGFTPTKVVNVAPAPAPIQTFTVTDDNTGALVPVTPGSPVVPPPSASGGVATPSGSGLPGRVPSSSELSGSYTGHLSVGGGQGCSDYKGTGEPTLITATPTSATFKDKGTEPITVALATDATFVYDGESVVGHVHLVGGFRVLDDGRVILTATETFGDCTAFFTGEKNG